MRNVCSVFSLCMAAVATLVSVALVGIAFSTDNWLHITVDRSRLEPLAQKDEYMKESMQTDTRYFDRVKGIFRVCFPHGEKPQATAKEAQGTRHPRLYLNPIDEWCTNVDYYMQILDHGLLPEQLTKDGQVWFHFARTSVAAFCLYFMTSAVACVTGLMGCWKASGDHLISTATLMLLASLCGAAGMGFWHGANFYEMEKVYDARLEFYPTWPEILRSSTAYTIGWSYILAWIGVAVAFISSLAYSTAAISLRSEMADIKQRGGEALIKHRGGHTVCQHPQIYHPQFVPRPMSAAGQSYFGGSQISLNHPEMPPMPMHASSGYYTVGYPNMHHHPVANVYSDVEGNRTLQYKSVVKELEDSKI